uniref:Uncharacterized LOC105917408 n=1 Tax=Fundulus heteroclitus TaxID=8078 RepID=A0A3Q2ULX6_FUNHE
MAEGSSVSGSEGLEEQLQSLLSRFSGDESGADSELFCADFCKAVEEHASHWSVPLPQLRILQIALHHFSQASAFLPTSCDSVQRTISSLALSVFELLLFFDQKDQQALEHFTATFQESHSVLAKYENVFLLHVERLLRGGGPWANAALQAILSESSLPQDEVDGYISSEPPVFLDLRVRYLTSCGRHSEAATLAKRCARHPAAGQLLFFLQVYLSWLLRTARHDLLHDEVADVGGKEALHLICSLEREVGDEELLVLSTAVLSQQLQRGDLHHLCDLVLVWTSLHRRVNTSKRALLEACRQLMLSATNVKSIFPFIRAVLQEVGEDGVQFCVELCANALRSCLPCDVLTKTLIYKTVAGLLPSDLDVCRVCALLVFFLERSVESYKTVYLLYMHPDQEYHVDDSPIGNNVRFETLQVLKKDLYFDPEFWNLMALRTSCLELMSEKVVSAALEEIMEDKWISKYCTRSSGLRSVCQRGAAAKRRRQKEDRFCKRDSTAASKRLRMDAEKLRLNNHALRRRGGQSRREASAAPLRRSFWQLDRIHGSLTLRYDEHRRTTRFSERNLPKRKIKKPKWLLEDSGTLEIVPLKMKKNGLKQQRLLRSCVMKRPQRPPVKSAAKLKPPAGAPPKAKENAERQNGFPLDAEEPASPPHVILELSLPDNELLETFSDDACSKPRRLPQVLLYKARPPDGPPPARTGHGKEVVLRARDGATFAQLLHCYARRQKGNGSNLHSSVSTITRSSAQVSPTKESELCERPVLRERGPHAAETSPQSAAEQSSANPEAEAASPNASGAETFEEPAVEMKVTIASPASVLDKVSPTRDAAASHFSRAARSRRKSADDTAPGSISGPDGVLLSPSEDAGLARAEQEVKSAADSAPSCRSAEADAASEQETEQQRVAKGLRVKDAPASSSSTMQEQEAPAEDAPVSRASAKAQDAGSESSEPAEAAPETEESRLEHHCSFCSKLFTGARVVEHAMFHFRRDECTFCRTAFKDDLLAMMHLSDHIEKMKRLRAEEAAAVATATPRAKAANERPRRSAEAPQSSADAAEPRALRSEQRQTSGTSSQEKQASRRGAGEAAVLRVNGHIGRKEKCEALKKDLERERVRQRLRASQDDKRLKPDDVTTGKTTEESLTSPEDGRKKRESSQLKRAEPERAKAEPQRRVSCPVKSCSWAADLLKNRVSLLYHVLDNHGGDATPLELAFRVGNGKCGICMRVMWSFEHFRHHVERHRLAPRHPCPHRGCGARFKSGNEMRRHARKHSPLQAACCRPGCPRLFICLWALNLHEKEHYGKSAEPEAVRAPEGKRTQSSEGAARLRERERNAAPSKTNRDDAHRRRNRSTESDASEDSSSPAPMTINLRLRQTRKLQPPNRAANNQRGVSSSLRHRRHAKSRLRLRSVRMATRSLKRRRCPPRLSKTAAAARGSARTKGEEADGTRNQAPSRPQASSSKQPGLLRQKQAADKKPLRNHAVPSESSRSKRNKAGKVQEHKRAGEARHKPSAASRKTPEPKAAKAERPAKSRASSPAPADPEEPAAAKAEATTRTAAVRREEKADVQPEKRRLSQKAKEKEAGSNESAKIPPKSTVEAKDPDRPSKAAGAEGILKGLKKLIKSTLDEKGKRKEASDASSPPSTPPSVLTPAPPAAPEPTKPSAKKTDKPRRPNASKQSESSRTAKRSREVDKDKTRKAVKKKRDEASQPAAEASARPEQADAPPPPPPPPEADGAASEAPSADRTADGTGWTKDVRTPCKKTLAAYGKKPYLRLPPTAYLDEKYTAMPKRRKEAPPCPSSRDVPESARLEAALQRHRCAKCFSTFRSAEELQSHGQQQKCSNLFGFDSDDEGNS